MGALWNNLFYEPIYNFLIFIVNNVTFGDVGFAVILVTLVVKFILSPLTLKSVKSQVLMKKMEPEINQIKKDFPNKEEQAKKTMELYKKYKTNPMSGCLVVLLQMPVIFALYYVFYRGLSINQEIIYPFIKIPEILNTNFLGILDLSQKSLVLGVLTGITQFIQGYLSNKKKKEPDVEIIKGVPQLNINQPASFQEQMSKSMQMNVRYFLPIMIGFIAWKISAAVALYWIISNIFSIVQESIIRRRLLKD
jgi:YidC/Oxa1 family membrane protein insertase